MARDFDSDDIERAEDIQELRFAENVECPECGTLFEGEWYEPAMSVHDIVEAPEARHRCPLCALEFTTALTGWTMYTEAG